MNRRIEKQLHDVFDPLAPDIVSRLKTMDYGKIESEKELFSEYRRPYAHSFMRAGSLAAMLIVACILSAFLYFTTSVAVGTVTIRADQNYRLSINRKNRIISVEMEGKEGGRVSVPDLKGKDLDKGLDLIFDSAHKSSSDKKARVEISYSCRGRVEKTEKIITDCVDRYAQDMDIIMNGKAQSASHSEEAVAPEEGQDALTADSEGTTAEDPAGGSGEDGSEDPAEDPSQPAETAAAAASSESTETAAAAASSESSETAAVTASPESTGKDPSAVLSGELTETTSREGSSELEETASQEGSTELTEIISPDYSELLPGETETESPAVPESTTEIYSPEEMTESTEEGISGTLLRAVSQPQAEEETQVSEMP